MRPGELVVMATSLALAQAWEADCRRRGCQTRLVPLKQPWRTVEQPVVAVAEAPLPGQLALF